MSISSVLVVAACFLAALLITLYLLFLRINRCSSPEPVITAEVLEALTKNGNLEESKIAKEGQEAGGKKKKKKGAAGGVKKMGTNHNNHSNTTTTSSSNDSAVNESTESVSSNSSVEEDDILMLAQLKGYNVSGLRKRSSAATTASVGKASPINKPVFSAYQPVKPVATGAPVASTSAAVAVASFSSSDSLTSLSPEELAFIASEAVQAVEAAGVIEEVLEAVEAVAEAIEAIETVEAVVIEKEPVSAPIKPSSKPIVHKPVLTKPTAVNTDEWSSVPTREEEALKVLKLKLATLQEQLDSADATCVSQERALEAARRRAQLMELEAKDARKLLVDQKRASDAQLVALKASNADLTAKLARMEALVVGEAAALQAESEEAKRTAAQLEAQLIKITGEARRHEEAQKIATGEVDRLAAELEEARRELQLARLHQRSSDDFDSQIHAIKNQNSQLAEEAALLQTKLEQVQEHSTKVEAALQRELDHHRAEQAAMAGCSAALHEEIAGLKEELEKTTASLKVLQESSASAPPAPENNDEDLKIQLAEAEEKIAALQADLAREIKRADVAKRVYDVKLAELNKN